MVTYFASNLLSSAVAQDKSFAGRCLYLDEQDLEQKFKPCKVNIQQNNLAINFDKWKYQGSNKTVSGQSVMEIASGEYAKKLLSDTGSLISGILFAPINIVGKLVAPNRDYQQYIIEYKNTKGEETATVLNINRSDAPEFQQELTLITGKLITFQPGQTKTTIDVGPDF